MLALRQLFALRLEQFETGDQLHARLGRVDDVVDVAAFRCGIRVRILLGVLGDEFSAASDGIGCLLELAAIDDLDCPLWPHDGELGGWPGIGKVGADGLRVHDDVGAAVGLAGDHLDARDGGLAVGVQQLCAVADDAAVFLVDSGQEPGDVDEGDDRDVERVAGAYEARGLLARLDVEHSCEHHRLVADDADSLAVQSRETTDDALGPVWEVLEELTVVHDLGDDLLHVIGLVGRCGQDAAQRFAEPCRVVGRLAGRWIGEVVLREEAQQIAHVLQAGVLVLADEGGDTALGGVAHRAAEFLERHVLAGHGLHDIRAGDEHVAGFADHEDEVGHRR